MDGPERLEDDARPARRATWVVVAVAVAVVAALGAVRVSGVLPDPAPTAPASTPTAATLAGWPQGIGGGTLYVLDAAGVAAVDVSRGRVTRSALRVDPTQVDLTAGGAGVLVWYPDGDGTPRLVDSASDETPSVGPALARARQVLPGPGAGMWTAESVAPDDSGSAERWRLLAPDGTTLATAPLAGAVRPDGAGGLFVLGDDQRVVVHVVDGRPTTAWRGTVGAVGLQGWEARTCRKSRCTTVLHDRASGAETPLASLTPSDAGVPVLSLGSRFVASLRTTSEGGVDRTVVRVAVPGAARELRSFPAALEGPTPLVWLSDRWLAAAGDSGLVLYDAVDDRLVTLQGEVRTPSRLVLRPV